MSLLARAALYLKQTVSARYAFTPAPINAQEVRFIRDCFGKLGTVEYFSVAKTKQTEAHLFGQQVTVTLSPGDQLSQLDPFAGIDRDIQPTAGELRREQEKLAGRLRRLIGLPRYSYIENDGQYMDGQIHVPFKHALIPDASRLMNQYRMSTSTVSSPFVFLEEGNYDDVVSSIRHNFQKYHKIQRVFVETGLHGVSLVGAERQDVSVKVDDNAVVSAEDIMDLDKELDIRETRAKNSTSYGFFPPVKPKI